MGDGGTDALTQGINRFSLSLYQKLGEGTMDNIVVSPLAVHVALTLVQQGADGPTAQELADLLGCNETTLPTKLAYRLKLFSLQGQSLKMANKLFITKKFTIDWEFAKLAERYFLSDVGALDFTDTVKAVANINKYGRNKIGHEFDLTTVEELSPQSKMVVASAVNFKNMWRKSFTPACYRDFKAPNHTIVTWMMSQIGNFPYKNDTELEAKVVKIDYGVGNDSLIMVLPIKVDGLAAVEAKLANMTLEHLLSNMPETRVQVTMPKFTLDKTISVLEVLKQMGVRAVFDGESAKLPNIGRGKLHVSDVRQRCLLHFKEMGLGEPEENPVYVKVGFFVEPLPRMFIADHPFFFGIINKPDTVLFYGRLTTPEPV